MNSPKKYCTFWFPTIYHQELKRLREQGDIVCDENYHDPDPNGKTTGYSLEIRIDESENLHVTSKREGHVSFVVVLKKTSNRRNGFAQYEFDPSGIPNYEAYEEEVLKKGAYDLSKKFYHKHEVISGKDSALKAIITDTPERVDEEDNRFLLGFLTDYTDVFKDYAQNVSDWNDEARNLESDFSDYTQQLKQTAPSDPKTDEIKKHLEKMYHDLVTYCTRISRGCENALIEYTYCKTLLSSKYNKSFHHNLVTGNPTQDGCRRQALNIRNSIRYIENIKYKNQNRVNRLIKHTLDTAKQALTVLQSMTGDITEVLANNKKTEKRNMALAWMSVCLAIGFGVQTFIDKEEKAARLIWALLFGIIIIFLILWYRYPLRVERIVNKLLKKED